MRIIITVLALVLLASILFSCESRTQRCRKSVNHEFNQNKPIPKLAPQGLQLIKVKEHYFLIESNSQPIHVPNCPCMATPK